MAGVPASRYGIRLANLNGPVSRSRLLSFSALSSRILPTANAIPQSIRPWHEQLLQVRSLSFTPHLCKKGGKTAQVEVPSDPFDFSKLQDGIDKAHAKLKDDLSKLRAGGRFNPDTIESLRVAVQKDSKNTERLGDLAQVVPKGRVVNIVVGDAEHIKAISRAIQSSNLNLTPQQDSQNPQQLNVNLPPPTTESRKLAVQAASKAADVANTAVKNARAEQHKKLRAMQMQKAARPDDLRKAGEKMEKVVEKGTQEVKKTIETTKKVLESA